MVDDAYSSRAFFIITEENITGYCIIIAMPQDHTSLAFFKNIAANLVSA